MSKAFLKTLSWQTFCFVVTMLGGYLYYGNWSITTLAIVLFCIFPLGYYLHELLWSSKLTNRITLWECVRCHNQVDVNIILEKKECPSCGYKVETIPAIVYGCYFAKRRESP